MAIAAKILHAEQPLVAAFGVGKHAARRGAVDVPALQQKADETPLRHVQLLGGGAQVGAVPQVDEQIIVDGLALQPGVVLPQRRIFSRSASRSEQSFSSASGEVATSHSFSLVR